MSDVVIRAEGLGKKYVIGHQARREVYSTLRDAVARGAHTFLRKAGDMIHGRAIIEGDELEEVWALRDVSFEIHRGDVVGIIGRNGAGKSTLLKILSRITEPTTGRVEVKGRVASLLEVGTGFHPELSGRENIFLNGAILGMRREEISRKFDAIVAFAEVERYLDTPVKRYSSGMYVRLAFAVAAHLEPEILIVDEVLAVGDAEFQRKCIGTMQNAASHDGRTVLFVSHNLTAIRSLCRMSIVLSEGRIKYLGPVERGIIAYSGFRTQPSTVRSPSDGRPSITSVSVDEEQACSGNLEVRVEFEAPWELSPVLVGVVIRNQLRTPIFGFNTWQDATYSPDPVSRGVAILKVPNVALHSGVYTMDVFLGEKRENYDVIENAVAFTFVSPEPLPGGLNVESIGAMRVRGHWTVARVG